jgi:hypothetical protein
MATLAAVIRLDAASLLLQWSAGGMLFCWFTTRRREVGVGYGWLLRGTYLLMAVGAIFAGFATRVVPVREVSSIGVAVACLGALVVSIRRRKVGVSGQQAEHDRRTDRVAAMTGIERTGRSATATLDATTAGAEFPPLLDLLPAVVGVVGLAAAGVASARGHADAHVAVAIARMMIGAAFLGSITDAMLLGHWYLVQPGLPRRLLNELVSALGWVWPAEVIALLLPVGMISVFNGSIDDGWNGMLGWFWIACALSTIVLVFVTRAALRERYYSAVMAATGLLYLAILTAFGTDLVARAVLSG